LIYDFNSYKGNEIKQGILFSKESYKKFYNALKTKDSLNIEYSIKDSLQELEISKLNNIIVNKDSIIKNKDSQIKNMEFLNHKMDSLYNDKALAYNNTNNKYNIEKSRIKYIGIIGFVIGILIGSKIF
jgi:hypothetical protein